MDCKVIVSFPLCSDEHTRVGKNDFSTGEMEPSKEHLNAASALKICGNAPAKPVSL